MTFSKAARISIAMPPTDGFLRPIAPYSCLCLALTLPLQGTVELVKSFVNHNMLKRLETPAKPLSAAHTGNRWPVIKAKRTREISHITRTRFRGQVMFGRPD
jgi:hypothetical protein